MDERTRNETEAYEKKKQENDLAGKKTEAKMENPLGRAWPNYNIANHDHSRAASRFGNKLLDAMNMVIMMLQGSPITYYGDEIGMEDYDKASETEPDPKRNLYRTPMQWDGSSEYAGKYYSLRIN